jgi:Arc/MetJ family transcription regulator
MSRTNIDIDDRLVEIVMRRYNLSTKREAVDVALRQLVGEGLTREQALELEGSGWEGGLETLRSARTFAL